MIHDLLKHLGAHVEAATGIKYIIEPSLAELDQPNVRISIKSPQIQIDEDAGYGTREFGGKVYSGTWLNIQYPLTMIFNAQGEETAIKDVAIEDSLKLARLFYYDISFSNLDPALTTLYFPGEFTAQLKPSQSAQIIKNDDPGAMPWTWTEGYSGTLFLRKFEDLEETGKFTPPITYQEYVS